MKVLGIDTGLATVGWAVVEKSEKNRAKPKLIGAGAIITKSSSSFPKRLEEIHDSTLELIETHEPETMAIESVFYFKNQKTVISVSQARGALVLAGRKGGLPIFDYTPLQVKTSITGYGRADKEQIQKMVQLMYGLKEVPKPDDVADAIAVATCHINTF